VVASQEKDWVVIKRKGAMPTAVGKERERRKRTSSKGERTEGDLG